MPNCELYSTNAADILNFEIVSNNVFHPLTMEMNVFVFDCLHEFNVNTLYI